jgi:hypothetical protein
MAQVTTLGTQTFRPDQGRRSPVVSIDSAANDSDKTMTVPNGQTWGVQCVAVSLATTADVGNRLMAVAVSDGTQVIGTFYADSVQTASTTEYYYFSPAYGTATESPTNYHYAPLPISVLGPGYTLRVLDSAAIAAAGDDMSVFISGIAAH